MEKTAKQIAEKLLQIKAIKLEPANHFTWASGWFSPIYCDNRKTLSFPQVRNFIRDSFVEAAKVNFPEFDVVAGVATGAIAQGVLVADALNKPFVYVRPKAKAHGMGNQIEGSIEPGQKVLVIEDLISTGGSSLSAVKALREANADVVGMIAVFSYNFETADNNFKEAGVKLITLSDYNYLLAQAKETGYVSESDIQTLQEWRQNPAQWKK
jgi:orotate phosphoribosyltransferase